VPQAPSLSAVAATASANITITPGATGGSAITQYSITSDPATTTQTTSGTSYTFTGLTDGVPYTFTATATNANGTSAVSAASNSITTSSWSPEGAYDALATFTLSQSTSSITFSGIPSGYKHLQIRAINRDSQTNTDINSLYITFNGIGGSNYSWHRMQAFGTGSPVAGGISNTGNIWIGPSATNGYTSGTYSAHIIDILDYSSNTKFKTVKHIGGLDSNGVGTEPGEINLTSGLFMNTGPITSITIDKSGQNQLANSHFALYGVK
jgi:hypothetical protein